MLQPFCSFTLAGMSLTDYGLEIPSPFCSLELSNSQITSFTSWTLNVIVAGDDKKKSNIAAFEALLYSAAQEANKYPDSSGIPVSFMFGWLNDDGSIGENVAYQGFTLQFQVSTDGLFMRYTIQGYASLGFKLSLPVYNIPAVCGMVKPSALVEGLCKAVKMDKYYVLDIDHNDNPVLVNHGALTTSPYAYFRGNISASDDYETWPGCLVYSKSYNSTREAAGVRPPYKINTVLNNATVTPTSDFLVKSFTDSTPQSSSFTCWIDEPTMTHRGVFHYKSTSGLNHIYTGDTLQYGTANTNILSISGSYSGISYNMTNMAFASIGFSLDGSGNTIVEDARVVNSWSSTLADVFQTANIINDVNALASQFSNTFSIVIPGNVLQYTLAQPVSLLVMSGNTLSPISGIYSIQTVTHNVSSTFTTTLKVQRLVMSKANEVASAQGITVLGSDGYNSSSYTKTKNIISTEKVDFGDIWPTCEGVAG